MKDSAAATATDFPVDASCWLCLEEGPHESGEPLVRDCSCRGSAGVAHISCIINYAQSESRRIYERDAVYCSGPLKCIGPFYRCPNCKQTYQNDLRKTLAKVCIEFVESELDADGNGNPNEFLHMHVMVNQMTTLDAQDADDNLDAEAIAAKFISAQNRLESKLDLDVDGRAKRDFQDLVANGYATIAAFYRKTRSQEGQLKAIEFFEKASDVFKTMDTPEAQFVQKAIDKNISEIHSELSGNVVDGETSDGNHYDVKFHKEKYRMCISRNGESEPMAIDMGVEFAFALMDQEFRTIEAERLLRKLLDMSRLTHGPDHGSTKKVLEALHCATMHRKVVVVFPDNSFLFQALRYENDGEECVVQGPIGIPRQIEEEEEFTMDSIDVIPSVGTPVICHSLQKAAHLNGKMGEVRKFDSKVKEDGRKYFDKDVDRCVVYFEDEGLKPVSVKATNLRVVFDLPNSDDD